MPKKAALKRFNLTTQHYGDFFRGYPWTLYGCLTFRKKVSDQHAEALLKAYMRRLGTDIEGWIPYIAVPEYRNSGCGMPGIPLHYHFLAACPQQWKAVLPVMATQLWKEMAGNCKVDTYDPGQHGAHYMAKLANHENFHLIVGNLERITYTGPVDLYRASQRNPYVPIHAKRHTRLSTLTLRNSCRQHSSSLQSIAAHATTPASGANPQEPHPVQTHVIPAQKAGKKKVVDHGMNPPKQLGPSVPWVFAIWREQMKKWFDITVKDVPLPQEYGQLSLLRNELGPATLAVIEHVVQHWQEFAKQASSQAGYGGYPHTPSISFLVAHRRTAFKMTYHSSRNKSWKTPRDWRVIKQAAILEQYWGKL